MWLLFRNRNIGQALIWMLAFAATLQAEQRNYVLGTTIDFVTGGQNNRNGAGFGQAVQPVSFFYAAYPSITMTSTGARSVFNLAYTFGFDRTESDPGFSSKSHAASLGFSRGLGRKWNLNLSESLQVTSDATTFNALRGVTPPAEDFRFLFDPVAVRRSSRSNGTSILAAYSLNDKSTLSIGGSHSLRDYGDTTGFGGTLTNQQTVSANITYTRRTAGRDAWTLTYTGAYFRFGNFENAHSDTGSVGYSTPIARDLTFQVTVGASQIRLLTSGRSYVGYNTSSSLNKTVEANSFSLYYAQDSGEPSGLGSISDTRRAGLGWNHAFRDVANVFADVSVFESKGSLDNPYETRGASAAASIGIPLTRTLSIQGGGQYQRYTQTSLFDFTQKRLFISLKLNEPNLWRFSK